MDIKIACQEALQLGISLRFLAQRINRDPTTLQKWMRGDRNISLEIQNELKLALRDLKEQWNKIEV